MNVIRRLFGREGPPVTLQTERFILRTLSRRQAARLSFPWTGDPTVMEPLEMEAGGWTFRRWQRRFPKANNKDRFCFGIEVRETRRMIGYETAQISRANAAVLAVAIGDHDWWGRGVVLETRTALLDFLFREKGCARAWGAVYVRNLSSVSNYLTLGFTHEGTLRDQFVLPAGRRGDSMVFGMLREEWLARRGDGQGHGSAG